MPRPPIERRKKQTGDVLQLPDGKQGILLTQKEFFGLKEPKPDKIVHSGSLAVVFEDRRRERLGVPSGLKPKAPIGPPSERQIHLLVEKLRRLRWTDAQIMRFLKARGLPTEVPSRKNGH